MAGNRLKILLLPLSYIYGFAVMIRNFLFDHNLLRSVEFPVAVISVGNITVGGTGKTPHIEYLATLLTGRFTVAILSRGYKRKTKGFVLASGQSGTGDIGDEPLQLKMKFPGITVAVDGSRRDGIMRIMKQFPETEVILLDDAFQHRWVKPGLSILLTDYNRIFTRDKLLPYGLLRENPSNSKRADIIIVSKSPAGVQDKDLNMIKGEISPESRQYFCFTTIEYGELKNIHSGKAAGISMADISEKSGHVLVLTGIANPWPLRKYIKEYTSNVSSVSFRDHHAFTLHDLEEVKQAYSSLPPKNRYIITTEKDYIRLREILETGNIFDDNFFYLPVSVGFGDRSEQERFNNHIINYVGKNRADSLVSKV